jgi:2-polyprenyl-3-methyl-5-hydroxy-6-metoxy-1,4-benzoquinol methylase
MPVPTPRTGVSRMPLFTSLSICAGTVRVDSRGDAVQTLINDPAVAEPDHPLRAAYSDKPLGYYGHARTEIAPLMPARAGRVLEVGCGRGATLAWLTHTGRCTHTTGIELFAQAADAARAVVDRVEAGDAEKLLGVVAQEGKFDAVLCLDVLEHLHDPWAFVRRIPPLLNPGGVLIVSVPNVRHWRVSADLLFRGRWRYADAGVLDRTHLRFFTRESARELVAEPRLKLVACEASRPPRASVGGLANLATLGLLKDLFAVQFLLAAHKA